jgi:hypothetical protein
MTDRRIVLRLNQQQIQLVRRTVERGEAADPVQLVRRALKEFAAAHPPGKAEKSPTRGKKSRGKK